MAADSVAALQSAGPAPEAGADDGGRDVLGADADADAEGLGLAAFVPGSVVPCGCGWLGPHAVSNSAAAEAAVVIKNPCEIR